jgi:hypothetical protein
MDSTGSFTGSFIWKRGSKWLIYLAALGVIWLPQLAAQHSVTAASGNAQVWGYKSGAYNALYNQMLTPDPSSMVCCGTAHWGAGPNALSDNAAPIVMPNRSPFVKVISPNVTSTGGRFVEAGPIKICNPTCGLHPYGNWDNGSGVDHTVILWSVNLLSGGRYTYKVVPAGNNTWQSQWCGSSCGGIVTSGNMGSSTFAYVLSGGESSEAAQHFGTVTTSYASLSSNSPIGGGNWVTWCYGNIWKNVSGSYTSCSNNSWSVSY